MICIVDDLKYSLSIKHMMDSLLSYEEKNIVITNEKNILNEDTYISIKKQNENIVSLLKKSEKIINKITLNIEENVRNSYKRAVFLILKDISDEDRKKWGILTGIRPVKLYSTLQKKNSCTKVNQILRNNYLVSDEKINLIQNIYNNQKDIISKIQDTTGLYINIPFCPSRCTYCSFFSKDFREYKFLLTPYLDAIEKEVKHLLKEEIIKDNIITTIYVGGGTPAILNEEEIARLIKIIKENFDLKNLLEFTFELGRPDVITKEKLKILKDAKIDRISINPQTMKNSTLKKIGRNHSVEEFRKKYFLARDMGFRNINMDFILGLDGENEDDMINSIMDAINMNPDSITIHSLALKTKSKMYQEKDIYNNVDLNFAMEEIKKILSLNGYNPYYLYRQKRSKSNLENIGFAREGKYSMYNIGMMDEYQNIIGIGAQAVSKIITDDKISNRIPNYKDVNLYINNIDEMLVRNKKY